MQYDYRLLALDPRIGGLKFPRTVISIVYNLVFPKGLGLLANSFSHDRLGDPPVNIKFNNARFFCYITPSPISVTVVG